MVTAKAVRLKIYRVQWNQDRVVAFCHIENQTEYRLATNLPIIKIQKMGDYNLKCKVLLRDSTFLLGKLSLR